MIGPPARPAPPNLPRQTRSTHVCMYRLNLNIGSSKRSVCQQNNAGRSRLDLYLFPVKQRTNATYIIASFAFGVPRVHIICISTKKAYAAQQQQRESPNSNQLHRLGTLNRIEVTPLVEYNRKQNKTQRGTGERGGGTEGSKAGRKSGSTAPHRRPKNTRYGVSQLQKLQRPAEINKKKKDDEGATAINKNIRIDRYNRPIDRCFCSVYIYLHRNLSCPENRRGEENWFSLQLLILVSFRPKTHKTRRHRNKSSKSYKK